MEVLVVDGKPVKAIYFHKPAEPHGFLSNWYPSRFEVDGVQYTSMEQYIMYRKCAAFGNVQAARQVMAADDPETQKEIAGNAKGYNETVWNGMRQVIAMRGLLAKFSQNEDLKAALLDTGDAYLVECARSDSIWACGLSLYDDARKDMSNWTGRNILGFALMEVRSMLRVRMGGAKKNRQRASEAKSTVRILQGDITKLDCDAIVNAANKSLLGGGGVDGAIHRAAGPELLKECRTLGGCQTGEAKITGGYRLPAKWVIHTVGPVYSGTATDAFKLADCYHNSLDLARKHGIHSIAFPAISTGVYGYPLKPAATIALTTVHQWLEANADYEMYAIFCCFDRKTYDVYEDLAAERNII